MSGSPYQKGSVQKESTSTVNAVASVTKDTNCPQRLSFEPAPADGSDSASGPAWVRLHALHDARLRTQRERVVAATAAKAAVEEQLVAAREARHTHAPVHENEARAFYASQDAWRAASDARRRAAWRAARAAEVADCRDPVLLPRSLKIAEQKGYHCPPERPAGGRRETKSEPRSRPLGRSSGGRAARESRWGGRQDTSSLAHRSRARTPHEIDASVRRQHDMEVERRRCMLKELIRALDMERMGDAESGRLPFHPQTTAHRSRLQRRTGREASEALYQHASTQRERYAERAADLERRVSMLHPFTPTVCAASNEMHLPRRRPLYPPQPRRAVIIGDCSGDNAAAGCASVSSPSRSVTPKRRWTEADREAFFVRNARCEQRRAARCASQRWSQVKAELEACTFRPSLTPRTRALAARAARAASSSPQPLPSRERMSLWQRGASTSATGDLRGASAIRVLYNPSLSSTCTCTGLFHSPYRKVSAAAAAARAESSSPRQVRNRLSIVERGRLQALPPQPSISSSLSSSSSSSLQKQDWWESPTPGRRQVSLPPHRYPQLFSENTGMDSDNREVMGKTTDGLMDIAAFQEQMRGILVELNDAN